MVHGTRFLKTIEEETLYPFGDPHTGHRVRGRRAEGRPDFKRKTCTSQIGSEDEGSWRWRLGPSSPREIG